MFATAFTRHRLACFLMFPALAACGSGQAARNGIITVPAEDLSMRIAMLSARETARLFAAHMGAENPPYEYAAIKVRLADRGLAEHLWARDPRLTGRTFTAVIGNDPVDQKGRARGDTIRVDVDSISDWMLIRGDTIFGGFTVYVLREKMNAAERAEFDAEQQSRRARFGRAALLPARKPG